MHLASDTTSPAHPSVVEAVVAANTGSAAPYYGDATSTALEARLAEVFETEVAVLPVTSGTAANALALSLLCPPYGSVLCAGGAHVDVDECGAPEFFTGGAKLQPLAVGADGRLHPELLREALAGGHAPHPHAVVPSALSVTQLTETGGLYRPDAVAALAEVAHDHGLRVHVDGARFASAVVASGASPADLTWRVGVDVLCLGATKTGAMAAEVVVLLGDARRSRTEAELRRKRSGHLLAKGRYVSAQLLAWLDDDLWLRLAADACARARRLADGVAQVDGLRLATEPHGGAVFVAGPDGLQERLVAGGLEVYGWPLPGLADGEECVRLVCSWSTTEREVDDAVAALRTAAGQSSSSSAA